MPQWRELYARFDPEEPAPPELRAPRPHSPVAAIAHRLDKQLDEDRILFVGTRGNGKTTELLRLAEDRRDREFVVVLDLVRHFDEVVADLPALERIRAWEVCFLAGLAVWRAAEDILGHRWSKDLAQRFADVWKRARDASRDDKTDDSAGHKLDIAKLAQTMIVAASPTAGVLTTGLKLLEAALDGMHWSVPVGSGTRSLPDQHGALQALLTCVNELIQQVEDAYHRRVFLVVDGLDRVTDDKQMRELFHDSQLLARFACPTVLCAPNLRHGMLTATMRRFRCEVLVNEPVLDHDDPTRVGPGVAFFRSVFEQRIRGLDLGPPPDSDLIARLAYYSGGQVRMFIKLVRSAAEAALLDDAPALLPAHVEKALDEQRGLLEMGLHSGHIDLLQRVVNDPLHRLPDDNRVWELLNLLRLMPYPNKSEWYYPHPLLMRSLVKPSPGVVG